MVVKLWPGFLLVSPSALKVWCHLATQGESEMDTTYGDIIDGTGIGSEGTINQALKELTVQRLVTITELRDHRGYRRGLTVKILEPPPCLPCPISENDETRQATGLLQTPPQASCRGDYS